MDNQTSSKTQRIKNLYRSNFFWPVLAALLLVGYFSFRSGSGQAQTQYITGQAVKGTLTVSVSGIGQVAAESQLDVKPSGSAKIVAVYVKQGQNVKAGDRIVMLDQTSTVNSINQSKAALASAKANYDSVIAGTTDTDLKLAKSSVESAQLTLDKAKNDLVIIQTQQDQAVSKALNAFLNASLEPVPSSGNVSSASLSITGNYVGEEQGEYVLTTYLTGNGMYFQVNGLETGSFGPIVQEKAMAFGSKGLFATFSTGNLYSDSVWRIELPNQRSSSYFSLHNAYQSALVTKQQTLQNAQNSVNSAQINLNNAQIQLEQKQKGSTNAQIESAAAQVSNAEANLRTAYTNYQNNIITAPFDGVIAQLSAKVGDQVNGGTSAAGSTNLATLITKQKIVNIALNEVDVAKIKIGDKVTITFDALGTLSMTGTVAQIDAIGTVSQGVVTYNVKISLDTDDEKIKPGMSASAQIITQAKTDVLIVPSSAIQVSGNRNYVQGLKNNQPYDINVEVGLSNDSETEIVSGLNPDDEIVVQTVTQTQNTGSASATNRNSGLGGFGAVRIGTGR